MEVQITQTRHPKVLGTDGLNPLLDIRFAEATQPSLVSLNHNTSQSITRSTDVSEYLWIRVLMFLTEYHFQ